jgi:hypothetical protein
MDMTGSGEATTLFHRSIGSIENDAGRVDIEYVDLGKCADDGCPNHAVGMVAITVMCHADDETDDAAAGLLIDAGSALALADRLRRAARLALEDGEVMHVSHEEAA